MNFARSHWYRLALAIWGLLAVLAVWYCGCIHEGDLRYFIWWESRYFICEYLFISVSAATKVRGARITIRSSNIRGADISCGGQKISFDGDGGVMSRVRRGVLPLRVVRQMLS